MMSNTIEQAVLQLPALALGLGAVLWLVRLFLQHIRESREATQRLFDRSDRTLEENAKALREVSAVLGRYQASGGGGSGGRPRDRPENLN